MSRTRRSAHLVETCPLHVRLSPAAVGQVDAIATANGETRSATLRALLRAGLRTYNGSTGI